MSLGPRRDGQRTVQLLHSNPRWRGIPDLDDAGPRAITAYFRTYGPATLDHLHYWLGNGLSAGRRRLEAWFSELGDRLVAVDVEGTTTYVVREDVDALVASLPSEAVRFLPGHDPWVIGPGTKDTHVSGSRAAWPTSSARTCVCIWLHDGGYGGSTGGDVTQDRGERLGQADRNFPWQAVVSGRRRSWTGWTVVIRTARN
jgi:hypothetical protein